MCTETTSEAYYLQHVPKTEGMQEVFATGVGMKKDQEKLGQLLNAR